MTTALLAPIRYGVIESPVLSGARSILVCVACAYLDDLLVVQIYRSGQHCILGLKTNAVKQFIIINKTSMTQGIESGSPLTPSSNGRRGTCGLRMTAAREIGQTSRLLYRSFDDFTERGSWIRTTRRHLVRQANQITMINVISAEYLTPARGTQAPGINEVSPGWRHT